MEQTIEKAIQSILLKSYENPTINVFDAFLQFCQEYFDRPAHSLAEIKLMKTTKLKGDIFEMFAVKYLTHCYKVPFQHVWLLHDVPTEILSLLKLKSNDMGIDIIAQDMQNRYYAVQVKYRKKGYRTNNGIPWQQLSTFYGLVNKTGPYCKYIIITNADYVRHVGRKDAKDVSICYKTLRNITKDMWVAMSGQSGQTISSTSVNSTSTSVNLDDMREKRLKFFEK